MPILKVGSLVVELPETWEVFHEKRQKVAHGPSGEEVIVSRTALEGTGTEQELQDLRVEMVDNAIESMWRSANQPDLIPASKVDRNRFLGGSEVLALSSKTNDGEVCFEQFTLLLGREIVFLTYEAPASSGESLALVKHSISCAANAK